MHTAAIVQVLVSHQGDPDGPETVLLPNLLPAAFSLVWTVKKELVGLELTQWTFQRRQRGLRHRLQAVKE